MIYVLDTNILIELEKGDKSTISKLAALNSHTNQEFYISSTTYSEFYYGYLNKHKDKQETCLEHLTVFGLLNTNSQSSAIFAQLKKALDESGKRIPLMDILTASIVISHGATLVTKDNHFRELEGLDVVVL